MKRYVGIDLSSTTGFFIQDEEGNIIDERDIFYEYKKDPERMIYITDEIMKSINLETDILGIEGFSYNSKGRGIDFQFGLGWIMREKLHLAGFSWYDITPTQVKKFATSNSFADKKVIQLSVKKRWDFFHGSDNITDAYVMSEIVKAIDLGKNYPDLKEHEKQVVLTVKKGVLNQDKWDKTKIPSWMNPRSKYYFTRENK